jgi:hypothetical protein
MTARGTAGAAAVVLALVVALSSCGGSNSGSSGGSSASSTTSSGATPASYRTSVNKICAAYNDSIRALPKSTTSSIAGLTTLANSAKNALAQVKAVTPPNQMAAAVNNWAGQLEQSEANVTKLLDAFKSGNTAQLRALAAQGTKLNAQSNAAARALGLPSCAQNALPSG